MRIRSLRTAVVEANYDWTLVRIETDTGIVGTGECFFAPGLTQMIRDFRPVVVGEDPRHLDRLFRKMQRAASGAGSISGIVYNAITGIEAALLDVVGKALGVPVWQLLGGKFRDHVRIYADCHAGSGLESYGPVLDAREPEWYREALARETPADPLDPATWAARARQAVNAGFDALKFDLDVGAEPMEGQLQTLSAREIRDAGDRIRAVRREVGPDVDLALDCHWRYSFADISRVAREIEDVGLLWLEDPFPPFNVHSFLALRESCPVPLCTGENLFLRHGFRDLIEKQAVHIVSPDLQKVGGLLEARRIADHADMYDLLVAPHCIAGPIGMVASAHLCAAIPNFCVLEFHGQDVPFWNDVAAGVPNPLIQGGRVRVPDGPGLGVEVNEAVVREHLKPGEGFFDP